jgi:hypothetical protein
MSTRLVHGIGEAGEDPALGVVDSQAYTGNLGQVEGDHGSHSKRIGPALSECELRGDVGFTWWVWPTGKGVINAGLFPSLS